jgi:hypothetical protein
MTPLRLAGSLLLALLLDACSDTDEGTDDLCSNEHVVDDIDDATGAEGVAADAPTLRLGY